MRGSVGSDPADYWKRRAEVILYDGNDKKDAEAMKAQLGEGSKVRVVLGAFPEEEMESLDLVVMSPGVPTDLPVVLAMKEKEFLSGARLSLPMYAEKEMCLELPEPMGKRQQPLF